MQYVIKSHVSGFTRTRSGHFELVHPHERKGDKHPEFSGTANISTLRFRDLIANLKNNGWKTEIKTDQENVKALVDILPDGLKKLTDFSGEIMIAKLEHPVSPRHLQIYLPKNWDEISDRKRLFYYLSDQPGSQL